MKIRNRPVMMAAIAAGLAVAFLSTQSWAEMVAFKAELNGKNEAPPNISPATGICEATFDTETRTLTWTVAYEGLSAPAIGAHFHGPSDAGKNAGIAVPMPFVGSPSKGDVVLTPTQAADLMDGKWYVNIHTVNHPGGEIRGQMLH